jgi:hypothetical protein
MMTFLRIVVPLLSSLFEHDRFTLSLRVCRERKPGHALVSLSSRAFVICERSFINGYWTQPALLGNTSTKQRVEERQRWSGRYPVFALSN